MATGDHTEWPLFLAHFVQIRTHRERAIVRVWPVLNILMPLYLLATICPFKVKLGVVKLHVRAYEVTHDIGKHRVARELPVALVVLDGRRQPA